MSRTAGRSPNIKAWDVERLINDLALGRPYSELVNEYGVAEQSLHAFKMRHKADIEAKKQDQAPSTATFGRPGRATVSAS